MRRVLTGQRKGTGRKQSFVHKKKSAVCFLSTYLILQHEAGLGRQKLPKPLTKHQEDEWDKEMHNVFDRAIADFKRDPCLYHVDFDAIREAGFPKDMTKFVTKIPVKWPASE